MSAVERNGFEFVQRLAEELSLGQLQLPSLPDVVVRVKAELAKEDFDVAVLSRIIASEPVLAGRVMAMANSVLFRRSGPMATELRTAIARLGGSVVRNAALSFALGQLRQIEEFRLIEDRLAPEWERGTQVASIAYLLGRRTRGVNADEAMLTGLVHNIGRIYMLSRASEHPLLFMQDAESEALMSDWHPAVGRAILESWRLSDTIVEAVATQCQPEDASESGAPMTGVLVASLVLADADPEQSPEAAAATLADDPAVQRLGLDADTVAEILGDAAADARELSAAMSA